MELVSRLDREIKSKQYVCTGVGQDIVARVATRYGLGVQGSHAGRDEVFLTCPDGLWGPPSLLYI
jgi:hypothetical protein